MFVKNVFMNFSNYPVLKLLIPLLIGIILGGFSCFYTVSLYFLLGITTILLPVSFILFRKTGYYLKWLPGILMQFYFLSMGFITIRHNFTLPFDENEEMENLLKDQYCWMFHIIDNPSEKANSMKCIVQIISSPIEKIVKEKAIIYIHKDTFSLSLSHGDIIFATTVLSRIAPPQNPYAFNYRKYMQKKGVHFTGYIHSKSFEVIDRHNIRPIKQKAYSIQKFFSRQLALSGMDGDEYGILTAILLGNDETMNPALRSSYASAGVSHILCVSGMHVGILFMIVSFLLKPFAFHSKGRIIRAVIILLIVWSYALITGFSPSVQRAASMFSFVTLGELLRRNTNVFHSLFSSLFILLALNPILLYETGFQLSYLAVFGIVLLQRPVFSLWKVKNRIVRYFWELATVSIAAQIFTFPIAVYYFGQFPNYFLLSNLSVMILSFVIVMSGIIMLIFSFSETIVSFLGKIVFWEIKGMNTIITRVENLPGAVSENLSLHIPQVVLFYLLILSVFFLFTRKNKYYLWVMLFSLLMLSLFSTYRRMERKKEISVTIYAINKKGAILFNSHGKGMLLTDGISGKSDAVYRFAIQNHEREKCTVDCCYPMDSNFSFTEENFHKKGPHIFFQGIRFYLLSGKQKLYTTHKKLEIDYLLLRSNPYITPEVVSGIIDFEEVIIDGSVNHYYEKEWINFCEKRNIPYHSIKQNGAKQIMIP